MASNRLLDIIKREVVDPSMESTKTSFPATILEVNYENGTATIQKLTGENNPRIKNVNLTYSEAIKGDWPEPGDLVYADFSSSMNNAVILQIYKKNKTSSYSSSNMKYKHPSFLNNPSHWV